jgi:hypothetical protein
VNLGVAKDQRLSLNPSQISGACGRLMCCLRYEHEFYVQSRRKYPKEGKAVRTSRGEEKVIANDIFRERVTLRGLDGEMRTLPLAELRDEMTAAGDVLVGALEAAARETPADATVDETDDLVELESREGEESFATRPVPDVRRPASPPRAQPERPRSSVAATAGPSSTVTDATAAGAGEKRTQRRRGRRGGRRNRPGGAPGSSPPSSGGSPPTGE